MVILRCGIVVRAKARGKRGSSHCNRSHTTLVRLAFLGHLSQSGRNPVGADVGRGVDDAGNTFPIPSSMGLKTLPDSRTSPVCFCSVLKDSKESTMMPTRNSRALARRTRQIPICVRSEVGAATLIT